MVGTPRSLPRARSASSQLKRSHALVANGAFQCVSIWIAKGQVRFRILLYLLRPCDDRSAPVTTGAYEPSSFRILLNSLGTPDTFISLFTGRTLFTICRIDLITGERSTSELPFYRPLPPMGLKVRLVRFAMVLMLKILHQLQIHDFRYQLL